MSVELEKGNWHLRKDVNMATVFVLLAGVCSGIYFAAEMEHRLDNVEKSETLNSVNDEKAIAENKSLHEKAEAKMRADHAAMVASSNQMYNSISLREQEVHTGIHEHMSELKTDLKAANVRLEKKIDLLIEKAMVR